MCYIWDLDWASICLINIYWTWNCAPFSTSKLAREAGKVNLQVTSSKSTADNKGWISGPTFFAGLWNSSQTPELDGLFVVIFQALHLEVQNARLRRTMWSGTGAQTGRGQASYNYAMLPSWAPSPSRKHWQLSKPGAGHQVLALISFRPCHCLLTVKTSTQGRVGKGK